MNKIKLIAALAVIGAAAAGAYKAGYLDGATPAGPAALTEKKTGSDQENQPPAPAITVQRVRLAEFVETVDVTGSLIAREEIQVAPEVEGLKVLSLNADEGDWVKKGDVLAVLVTESLETQIAQVDALIARATAGIARAKSLIMEAEARVSEANASFERARPLAQSRYLSESTLDQREAAAKSARAQLALAKDGLGLAEAEKGQADAQKRELLWKLGNTSVRAPEDGLVSRRMARIGAIATGATEPMFRIIRHGEIELDAEISETRLAKVRVGQKARVQSAGAVNAEGSVRLVSPEVDKATRLGHVRIFVGVNPALKTGAFGTAVIETARKNGLSIPQSAVLFGEDGPVVLAVINDQVKQRRIETGLMADGQIEVVRGLDDGDVIVTKAGTFLRDGDAVKPILQDATVSEVR